MEPTVSDQRASAGANSRLPVGTVTFLMTDIEGSTKVWDASPRAARQALDLHDRILVEEVERNQGRMVESGREGDSVLAVFVQATDAVRCALDTQLALQREVWPAGVAMQVRIAVHTGEADLRSGHYVGAPLYRCARLMATAHGGQVLISRATEEIVADSLPEATGLRDLGQHRLRDISRTEYVFQLMHPDLRSEFPPLKSLEPERTNLAEQLTSFVGRHAELSELKKLLKSSRLITLTGAGGIGKTRIAIQLAALVAESWPDGVWWIDLTPVADPQQVPGTIASALHLRGLGESSEKVYSWLIDKKALLLLDNCEHLVAACATFCRTALEACPELSIVATSREALGVQGEVRWPVSPMNPSDALALFLERGRLAQPTFTITDSNRSHVTEICARLDDLPLAIELAASRLGMMTERQISTELADRFHLLSVARSADPRHQTMTATIDWSYRLLTESEATLFRRLSVFRGGFALESAKAVCGDGSVPDVLNDLRGLVEKSMVVVERLDDGDTRYRLLESQMVYAEEKLRASDELGAIQGRHYDHFTEAIISITPGLSGPMADVVIDAQTAARKRREVGNYWAAVRWARGHRPDLGLSLAAHFAFVQPVDVNQMRSLLSDLLRGAPLDADYRLAATSAACNLANIQGDYEGSLRLAESAVEMTTPHPTRKWKEAKAMALNHLGNALDALGRPDEAEAAYQEAVTLAEGSGNLRLLGALDNSLGCLTLERGRPELARTILTRSVELCAQSHGLNEAGSLDSLASAELACGDVDAAERSWRRSLSLAKDYVNEWLEITCLGGLSRVATARGDHARAIRLASAHTQALTDRSLAEERYWREQLALSLDESRAKLGSTKSAQAWSEGLAMGLERAVAYALEEPIEAVADSGPLSRREVEVAQLVAGGMTNRDIAEKLFLSERTVEGHVEKIRNKLGFRSRTEVARWAVEHQLIDKTLEPPSAGSHGSGAVLKPARAGTGRKKAR